MVSSVTTTAIIITVVIVIFLIGCAVKAGNEHSLESDYAIRELITKHFSTCTGCDIDDIYLRELSDIESRELLREQERNRQRAKSHVNICGTCKQPIGYTPTKGSAMTNNILDTLPKLEEGKKWEQCDTKEYKKDSGVIAVYDKTLFDGLGGTVCFKVVDTSPGFDIPKDFVGYIGEGWVRDDDNDKWCPARHLNAIKRSISDFRFVDGGSWCQARSAKPVYPVGYVMYQQDSPGTHPLYTNMSECGEHFFVWEMVGPYWILRVSNNTQAEIANKNGQYFRIATDCIGYLKTWVPSETS